MKRTLGFATVLWLIAAPALAVKVNIDYAHEFDFENLETFQYQDSESSDAEHPQVARRVVELIKQHLREAGLEEVQSDPDIFVTYHVTKRTRRPPNTDYLGYGGHHRGWYGWPATSSVEDYVEGTLIVDAYDSEEMKMVWRGMGTAPMKDKPKKRIRQVEKILEKLGKRWDEILHDRGK